MLGSWEVSPFGVVTGRYTLRRRDIVAFGLVPRNYLLGSFDAFRDIALAVDRYFGSGDGCGGFGASHHALEALHVDVGLSAAFWNPEIYTRASFRWARW